ncbi:MAG: cob(I)yrinic acid a,c-diamide adenosyltransferase [Dehalococcoidales bacterium]|nr:cob(I)yrinic acid a,c-diamide adenosyltransferase [Dehalococcoidales bacterium]
MLGKKNRGLIQIYTGDGKGKTTAALGLAMRAAGRGLKVGFIQFLKGKTSGEHLFLSRSKVFKIVRLSNTNSFTAPREQLREEAQQTLAYAVEQMLSGRFDMLILDEIFIAVHQDLISSSQVLELLEKKPQSVELVLTGRYAPGELVQRADLVTEMRMVKHPFNEGIHARPGIEY